MDNNNNTIREENHKNIEMSDNSSAFKILAHYFEVISTGVTSKYNDNLQEMLSKLDEEIMTDDIQICYDILKNPTSFQKMLKMVEHWGEHRGPGLSHDDMIEFCYTLGWDKVESLGQLWSLHVGLINN